MGFELIGDHGELVGLADDDHSQYLLAAGTREALKLIITDGAGHYFQVPQLTTTQRNALTPVNGMVIYNSTTAQFERYQGGAWGAFGVSDHGGLAGLADDDHSQYLNTTRHDLVARHPAAVLGTHGAGQHTNVTREKFISVGECYTTGDLTGYGYVLIAKLDPAATEVIWAGFKIPDDWVSLTSVKVICMAGATSGDFMWDLCSQQGAAGALPGGGEAYNLHADTDTGNVDTVPGTVNILFWVTGDATILAEAAAGDYVGLKFQRVGGDSADTLAVDLVVFGFLLTYTANQ